jgi:hypothetical protein
LDQIVRVLDPAKFRDPAITARGETRARVALRALDTLWFNTGTLCNLTCHNCYIESSPSNGRLAYLTRDEVRAYLEEIARDRLPTSVIGFTGGEPFMNRDIIVMLDDVLSRGLRALVLTNAMAPLRKLRPKMLALRDAYGDRLTIRVSLDHYTQAVHEAERGKRSWAPTIDGLLWLARNGFTLDVAGRRFTGESEITTACWGILHKSPDDVMCASSRMVVKRKDAPHPVVLACTLLAYDARFELGRTLAEAAQPVALNHPYCASFCVLGGAACSR